MGLLIFWAILFTIIVCHELGHLLMAKKYGVRVNVYSIGFGPRIIGVKFYKRQISWRIGNRIPTNTKVWFRKDNTEYRIAPIFFGGFCSLEGELKSTGKPYELATKPLSQKIQIILAGVGLNFITGFLALLGIAIKNHGFINGLKYISIFIYQIFFNLFYALCTGQIEITTAKGVNTLMSGLSFEIVLAYFGFLSILMAIFNVMPIPALDGSYPCYWLIEKISKGKATKALKIIWFISFILLMILQVIILYFWIVGK